jgi:predicted transcriptional regulator
MSEQEHRGELLDLTSKIVAAHVAHNSVAAADLSGIITDVYQGFASTIAEPTPPPEPAVSVKKSVTSNFIICLEDGKKLKMLKGHLQSAHGMTPEAYRAKWGLKPNYPMVAPEYAQRRREIARTIGLGRKPRKATPKGRGKKRTKK